ncbi:Hypothetical predicted protein [Pelobates cultripes]|uniref:Uncharacterized protein n=1 Tax=Pelobates cultripes TaxID=61616 RepID=A0AAD1S0R8_PELCU|nr:Hypothetical predicted protein [Pelobates cultripes]
MSYSTAPHTAQPMSSDWAAAFQARFDAICRRFWEHLENRRQPPAPTQVSIMARAPPTQQPAKDLSSEWRKTKAQSEGHQLGKATNRTTSYQHDGPSGTRATPNHHQRLRRRARCQRKHATPCSPTPGKDSAAEMSQVCGPVVPVFRRSPSRRGASPGLHCAADPVYNVRTLSPPTRGNKRLLV